MNAARQLAAECLGTAFLVGTVVGSGIMADKLAGGNVAIALLGNTIPTGAILVVLITMLGPISGAHFNPAVTLAFSLRGDHPWSRFVPYVIAQIVGGLIGTFTAHLMFGLDVFQASTTVRTGPAQWFAEIVATFGLVTTIFFTLRARADAVAMAVGLYITAAYWFTASTSFANPAVAIARGFTDTFSGIRPVDLPGFIIAECIGAAIAVGLASWFFAKTSDSEAS